MIARLLPILGITFIDILGFSIMIPLMPYFVKHYGASDFTVGLVFATFALCQFVAGPIWGNMSDRIGRKAVLIVSQIGATIGWAMMAFAPTIGIVFLARVIEGLSGGNLSVTQAYVADLVEPEKRGRAFSYIGAAFGAGMVFGPAAGGYLFGHYGFAAPFLAAAALQLITLIVTIIVLPESRSHLENDEKATPRDIARSLTHGTVAPVLWQKLVYSLGLYGFFSVFGLVLAAQLHFDAERTSYFFAAFGVASVIFQLFVTPRITEALGSRSASNLGFTLCIAAFIIVALAHNLGVGLLMVAVFSLGLSLNNATLPDLITQASPENQRGTILGVGSSLESLSGVVMPPISAGVLGSYGTPWTMAISATFTACALMLGIRAQRRGVRAAPTAAASTAGD